MKTKARQKRVAFIFRTSEKTAERIKQAIEKTRKATGFNLSASEWLDWQITKLMDNKHSESDP